MSVPPTLIAALIDQISAEPRDVRVLRRGVVNMIRCTLGGQACLIKWTLEAPPSGWPDRCTAEVLDLQQLAAPQALPVARVMMYAPLDGERPAFLVIDWITTGSGDQWRTDAQFGAGLAALHRTTAPQYGLDRQNYCGPTPQPNLPDRSWITFFGEQRLGWQRDLAAHNGYLPPARCDRLDRLIDRLDRWIDERAVRPALLHGDLWSGNYLIDQRGRPVLIDPAAYFGDREAELAMCRLFGGFSPTFFAAYDEAWPPAAGRDDRIALYQLYHLLNHLNVFGESYGAQVDQVLRRYVG